MLIYTSTARPLAWNPEFSTLTLYTDLEQNQLKETWQLSGILQAIAYSENWQLTGKLSRQSTPNGYYLKGEICTDLEWIKLELYLVGGEILTVEATPDFIQALQNIRQINCHGYSSVLEPQPAKSLLNRLLNSKKSPILAIKKAILT